MKKTLVSLTTGLIIAGTAATSASAATPYNVEKGDTLWGIAHAYETTVSQLQERNNIDSYLIYPGQTLTINGNTTEENSAEDQAGTYTVKQGDTLFEIGQQHGVSVSNLMEWNNLNSSLIFPAQELHLSATENLNVVPEEIKEKPVEKETVQEAGTYTVERGDTLSGIGQVYGVSVSNLKAWNNLSSNLIYPGQQLNIQAVAEKTAETNTNVNVNVEVNVQESQPQEAAPAAEAQVTEAAPAPQPEQTNETSGEVISVEATAYTANCYGCSGITATGINLNQDRNAKVIAVDPNVIPLGTRVYVEGYGEAIAGDTGGAINGNRIDLHVPTKDEAFDWGRRTVNVTILD